MKEHILSRILFIMLVMLFLGVCNAYSMIDIATIIEIESSGRTTAISRAGARGLMQIMPSTLNEFNQYKGTNYTKHDLFDAQINIKVGHWYMMERIPSMIRYFDLPDNVIGRLICYNAGIGRYKQFIELSRPIPMETSRYIEKYNRKLNFSDWKEANRDIINHLGVSRSS